MATPTQTSPCSMARVRPYKESDLAKLQELFHKNYPDLATPEFTNQDQLDLVLEDERGQVKMAIMGNSMVTAFPLLDPYACSSQADFEEFRALEAAAEQRLTQRGFPILILWLPKHQLLRRLQVEELGYNSYPNLAPYGKFLVQKSVTEKKQEN